MLSKIANRVCDIFVSISYGQNINVPYREESISYSLIIAVTYYDSMLFVNNRGDLDVIHEAHHILELFSLIVSVRFPGFYEIKLILIVRACSLDHY